MHDLKYVGRWRLVAIGPDGRPGETLARVLPIADASLAGAGDSGPEAPLFAIAGLDEATEDALSAALSAGVVGLLVVGGGGWDRVERAAVRLAVVEASFPGDRPPTGLLAMTSGADGVLARLGAAPDMDRLVGIGLDAASLAGPETTALMAPPAVATARGATLLAAMAAGVPAFERPAGPATSPALAAARAAGFAWALLPDGTEEA